MGLSDERLREIYSAGDVGLDAMLRRVAAAAAEDAAKTAFAQGEIHGLGLATQNAERQAAEGSEVWLPITGWPYEVSSLGRIRNADGKEIKQTEHRGYMNVSLCYAPNKKHKRVNRLVAGAFYGKAPGANWHASHINGDRKDNRAANIRWESAHDNERRKADHGTKVTGESHGRSKLTNEQAIEIRERYRNAPGLSQRMLAREFGVDQKTIRRVVNDESYPCTIRSLPIEHKCSSPCALCTETAEPCGCDCHARLENKGFDDAK